MRKESEENEGLTRYHQGDNKTRIFPTRGENQNSFQVSAREWYYFLCLSEELESVIVLVRVTITAMKHHDQITLGRKGFIWRILPHHCASSKKSVREVKQVRIPRQELLPRLQRGAACWLPHYCLHSLLSSRTQDHQDGPQWWNHHNSLIPPPLNP